MNRRQFILKQVRSDDRVLDVGCCGGGPDFVRDLEAGNLLHQQICARSPYVKGIDINKARICEMWDSGLYVQWRDIESFALVQASHQLCVLGDVLEHLGRPEHVLHKCRISLVQKGRMVIVTPNRWDGAGFLWHGLLRRPETNPDQINAYSMGTLSNLLDKCGLRVTQAAYLTHESRRTVFDCWPSMRPFIGVTAKRKEVRHG